MSRKNKNPVYNARINVLLLSIILCILIDNFFGKDNGLLSFDWVMLILLVGNIKRIVPKNRLFLYIRCLAYFIIPGLLGLTLAPIKVEKVSFFKLVIVIIFMIALLLIVLHHQKENIISQILRMEIAKKRFKLHEILYITQVLGSSICEELFFRNGVINCFNIPLIGCFISTIYFPLSHWLLPWGNNYKRKDLINQALLAFINSMVYLWSENILFPILIHIICNLSILIPYVCLLVKGDR